MGDLHNWSPPDSNGFVLLTSSSSSQSSKWIEAEDAIHKIISQVQPTLVSEHTRKSVIDFIQTLIKTNLGSEVFPFGSVPLKTYLPDGDIDLTTFGGINIEDAFANDVCSVLEAQDHNNDNDSHFPVKDVQLIRAEVKLVKCLVQNIVVDISFNQIGGLSTLCFLEEVDRFIGKDHLFKRSIILIKAWCYYESRILGAHHGLISTYALETLVLYIFHLFHSSLNGPLAVLYKFLDYFSKFDWDKYCISLYGPILISSLPEVVAEPLDNDGEFPLLSRDFLRNCVEKFAASPGGFDPNARAFPPKHLNIVDPLKDNNNLGRSISKGNFYRIKSAFTYGARKLGGILSQPVENIAGELRKTFANTLDRHGTGRRPDVPDHVLPPAQNGFALNGSEPYQEDPANYESEPTSLNDLPFNNFKLPGAGMKDDRSFKDQPFLINGTGVSKSHVSEDVEDLATSTEVLLISNKSSQRAHGDDSAVDKPHDAPNLYYSHSAHDKGEMTNGDSEPNNSECPCNSEKNLYLGVLPDQVKSSVLPGDHQGESMMLANDMALSQARSNPNSWPENYCNGYSSYSPSIAAARDPESLNSLSDLSGDNESNLNSLHMGRWCYEYALNAPPLVPPQYHSKNSWDVVRRSMNVRQMNGNGIVPRGVFPMNTPIVPGASFGMEEMPKPRGTGTYFPNTNHYRDRPFNARGWNQGPIRSPRSYSRAGDTNWSERGTREMAHAHHQIAGNSDFHHFEYPDQKAFYPHANGFTHHPEMVTELGAVSVQSQRATSLESTDRQGNEPALHDGSPSALETQNSSSSMDQDRIAENSYRLKDEEDFPPLST
ncbi:hypothetical protein ACFE04_003379 [Oxalis oulophora]